jgi:hypothetical protein
MASSWYLATEEADVTDSGHLRTSSLDELQAENRQSRQAADIRITFLEVMAGQKLQQWQRDVFEKIMAAPTRVMTVPRCRMRLPPPP